MNHPIPGAGKCLTPFIVEAMPIVIRSTAMLKDDERQWVLRTYRIANEN
ncbi:MAG: hypothetical protein HZB52_17010 [Chloroflexi bacterium]|nr:hypothetical protein [Chloroflexota bacterium]